MDMNPNTHERIKRLAATLKSNGLAGSDTQAMEMAKNMVQTDDKVMQQAQRNKTSMIRNYDVNKPVAREEQQQAPSTPWEKEETAQEHPARDEQGPAPSNNQALDQAISNVQEQFRQAQTHNSSNTDLPEHLSVEQAANAVVEEEHEQRHEERPRAPVEQPSSFQAKQEERVASVVENPLPKTNEPSAHERPYYEDTRTTMTPARETPHLAERPAPAQQERPATITPVRDVSKYEESRISLADVFNVNK
jgi:hypothetical protein